MKKRKYNHAEAFAIMRYKCKNGHLEILWNSRDGVTPFTIDCQQCNEISYHKDWQMDICVPDYKPENLRWFADLTKEKYEKELREHFRKEDEPFETISGNYTAEELITSMLEDFQEGSPTILSLEEVIKILNQKQTVKQLIINKLKRIFCKLKNLF